MVTMTQIAKACHISVATVSNVLNGRPGACESTKELVFMTAEELNYVPRKKRNEK